MSMGRCAVRYVRSVGYYPNRDELRGPPTFSTTVAVLARMNDEILDSTVTGVVTDQSNAAVPAAEVRLNDLSTNAALTASTNEAGRYIFVNVPPGGL